MREALLPFQREGVRFGLLHGGRALIADEMGVGKTVQAIALATCYKVCSSSLPPGYWLQRHRACRGSQTSTGSPQWPEGYFWQKQASDCM